jgi:RNA polymerase sigma factor (sigma-70 family)
MHKCSTSSSIRHVSDMIQALAEHERLVHWVVRGQWLGTLSYAAAVQVGRIALWQALGRYDPCRGYTFSSYAVPAIERALWRAVAQAQPHPQEVLTPHPPQAAPDLEQIIEGAWVAEALAELLAHLPPRLYTVIVARYGLHGHRPHTFAALGRRLGVTRQRAHQLHVEALLWLAHPAHSSTLRRLLDCNTVADYQLYLRRLRTWLKPKRHDEPPTCFPGAASKRAAHPDFWRAHPRPSTTVLSFPVPGSLPFASVYRSAYPGRLRRPAGQAPAHLSDWRWHCAWWTCLLALPRALRFVHSAKDDSTRFLCTWRCLRRELDCGWRKLALLCEHGAGWRRLFGFKRAPPHSRIALLLRHRRSGAL